MKISVGWTFMSTGPCLELQESNEPPELVEPDIRVLFCLPGGGSINSDTVDMNVHPTGRL